MFPSDLVLSGKPNHPACCGSVIGVLFPCRPTRGLPSRHKSQRIPPNSYSRRTMSPLPAPAPHKCDHQLSRDPSPDVDARRLSGPFNHEVLHPLTRRTSDSPARMAVADLINAMAVFISWSGSYPDAGRVAYNCSLCRHVESVPRAGIERDLGEGKCRPFLRQNRPGEQQECYEDQLPHEGVTGANRPRAHRGLHRRVLHQAGMATVTRPILVISPRGKSFQP